MKIITTGEWKKRVKCRGCWSTLEVKSEDIKHEEVMLPDESFAEQFFIDCPTCSQRNVQRDIPPKIQKEILHLTLG